MSTDKNKQNKDGDTALHIAVLNGNREAVNLLAPVTDLTIRNGSGKSPLDVAVRHNNGDIAHILIQNGASADDEDDFGNLHLHTVAAKGRNKTMSVLFSPLFILHKYFKINVIPFIINIIRRIWSVFHDISINENYNHV